MQIFRLLNSKESRENIANQRPRLIILKKAVSNGIIELAAKSKKMKAICDKL